MAKLTRRSLFPLAAAGMATVGELQGATLDPTGQPGIFIRIAQVYGTWSVLVPDFDSMNGWWRPGMVVPTKWMPIPEYLTMIEETYSVDK